MKVTFVSRLEKNKQGRKLIPIPKPFHEQIDEYFKGAKQVKITIESI